jgi:hypothetical protein
MLFRVRNPAHDTNSQAVLTAKENGKNQKTSDPDNYPLYWERIQFSKVKR